MTPDAWERFQRGDERAFRALVESYSPRLLAIVHAWMRDRDEAEDLLQDAWIRIYSHRSRCSGRGEFPGWAMTICRNLATDRFRSETSRKERQAAFTQASSDTTRTLVQPAMFGPPEDELPSEMLQELLELPDLQRDVVILRLLEGCSTRETAELLGRAPGTVKASLHRAVAKLKEQLQEWRS